MRRIAAVFLLLFLMHSSAPAFAAEIPFERSAVAIYDGFWFSGFSNYLSGSSRGLAYQFKTTDDYELNYISSYLVADDPERYRDIPGYATFDLFYGNRLDGMGRPLPGDLIFESHRIPIARADPWESYFVEDLQVKMPAGDYWLGFYGENGVRVGESPTLYGELIDNMAVSPEPSSFILMATGLCVFSFGFLRKNLFRFN